MKKKLKIWSSGGVILENKKILVCHRIDEELYCLPKGTPENNESIEETAIREVSEETGIYTKIISKLGEVHYKINKYLDNSRYENNTEYNKTVHFFLMNKISGSIKDHDDEFDKILWMSLKEVKKKLTYQNEISIVEKAFYSKN
tara:strand:+ start:8788 stop:9219 length:432 start_codon:yes stop_codon:yes gene_type:complete